MNPRTNFNNFLKSGSAYRKFVYGMQYILPFITYIIYFNTDKDCDPLQERPFFPWGLTSQDGKQTIVWKS
jgi:hypothetical protein